MLEPIDKPVPSETCSAGMYHWLLDNPRPLERPIPCLGKLGLFEVKVEKGATDDRQRT
jgi:hypothetical protein